MLWFGPGWKIPPYFYVLFGEEPNPIGITMKRPWSWALCFVIVIVVVALFCFRVFFSSPWKAIGEINPIGSSITRNELLYDNFQFSIPRVSRHFSDFLHSTDARACPSFLPHLTPHKIKTKTTCFHWLLLLFCMSDLLSSRSNFQMARQHVQKQIQCTKTQCRA